MTVKWIPIEKIRPLISYEAFLTGGFFLVLAYVFYYFFLTKISERRHGQLRHRFFMTSMFVGISGLMAVIYWVLHWDHSENLILEKFQNYIGLLTLIFGAIGIIRVAQIYVYLYLFFSNISTGVPRLIGNLFTFLFSIFLFGIIGSAVFDLNIATVATTSAVFSLVLGLALQDTLGNFFSGLALQIDRPFQINDWVEIQDGDQKWIGQIQEINWRATFLLSFSDELIMFPNKAIAQSKIVILTHNLRPVRLNQVFRFTLDTDIDLAKKALLEGLEDFKEVLQSPAPNVLVTETNESWITMKAFYSIQDYGLRYRIGDAIIAKILSCIRVHKLKLAHQTFTIEAEGH